MNRRTLRLIGWLAAVVLALGLGAALGGGVVYALTQNQETDPAVVDVQADAEPGLLVARVIPDGPAALAGLKRGDILLKIDDQPINRPVELVGYLQNLATGSQAQLTVLHGDEERTLTVTLGKRSGRAYLGLVPCGGVHRGISIDRVKPGVAINEVAPDSPAAQAGLQPGDAIVAVDGEEVNFGRGLVDLIAARAPGDTVTLTVERPGEEARQVTVQLGEHPEQEGAAYLGVRFRRLPGRGMFQGGPFRPGRVHPFGPFLERDFFPFPGDEIERGIIIRRVADDSPAAQAGLRRGDLVTAIDGQPVRGPRSLIDAVTERQPGDTLTLTVTRPDAAETREVTVTLAENPNAADTAYMGVRVGGFFDIRRSEQGVDILKDIEMFLDPDSMFDKAPFEFERELPFDELEFEHLCGDNVENNCFDNSI